MDKKDLKWYEAPVMEVVDVEVEGFLCASGESNADGIGVDEPEDGGEE